MVMEYMPGGSLIELIDKNVRGVAPLLITPAVVWKIALDTCSGMAHLHAEGILHAGNSKKCFILQFSLKLFLSDLSARNLLIDIRGGAISVKVADFGLSHMVADDRQAYQINSTFWPRFERVD
jgi:serine/threonine protein kinase